MNLGSTQMTKPISNVLKLETLGRKRNPSAGGQRMRGQGLRAAPMTRLGCKVIVITVQGGEALFSLQPYSLVFTTEAPGLHFGLCSNKTPLAQISHFLFLKSKDLRAERSL